MRVAVCLLLVVVSTACGDNVPRLPALAPDAVVLAFGDSLTRGTGAERDQGYPEQLGRLIGRRVVNAGVPGELSADGLRRLPALLDTYRPGLVILCHGGNDMLQRKSLAAVAENLAAMVQAARSAGAQVILIAVPRPRLLAGPEPLYADLGRRFGIPVLQESLTEILTERDLKADPVHPNTAGYTVLAREVARLLARSGAIAAVD